MSRLGGLRRALPWLLAAVVAAFVAWKLHTAHFDWWGFAASWRAANAWLLLAAVAVIYTNYVLRAMRWAIFLRPGYGAGEAPVPWWRLVGPQFAGFAGLAIFGRIGELIRPLLVARRTGRTFASQVAVVAVERVFDLGAFGAIFSVNLMLSPSLNQLPYHERFRQVGYAIAALTVAIAGFVLAVRVAGVRVAALARRVGGMISARAGASAEEKVLAFRDGMNVIAGAGDFVAVALLSLLLWGTIAVSYVLVMRAFPAPVQGLTAADTVVMMGFSVVGSIVQLPGVGGGAQVGTITALTLLFGIPKELAVSAGLMLWLVTTMAVIPAGLLFARVEGVSLTQAARRSEAGEEVKA